MIKADPLETLFSRLNKQTYTHKMCACSFMFLHACSDIEARLQAVCSTSISRTQTMALTTAIGSFTRRRTTTLPSTTLRVTSSTTCTFQNMHEEYTVIPGFDLAEYVSHSTTLREGTIIYRFSKELLAYFETCDSLFSPYYRAGIFFSIKSALYFHKYKYLP